MTASRGSWFILGIAICGANLTCVNTSLAQVQQGSLAASAGVCTIPTEFQPAVPEGYGAGSESVRQREEIQFDQTGYTPFGVPRFIPPERLQRIGEVSGTPIFAEAGRSGPFQVIYLVMSPECSFLPYQIRLPAHYPM
jgi:hypothetical protein